MMNCSIGANECAENNNRSMIDHSSLPGALEKFFFYGPRGIGSIVVSCVIANETIW